MDEPIAPQNSYIGVAQSLVRRGLPAVVALQFAPTTAVASTFDDEFYTAIANHTPVDLATTAARRAMQTIDEGVAWGAPVLLMRTPDGQLFENSQIAQKSSFVRTMTR